MVLLGILAVGLVLMAIGLAVKGWPKNDVGFPRSRKSSRRRGVK